MDWPTALVICVSVVTTGVFGVAVVDAIVKIVSGRQAETDYNNLHWRVHHLENARQPPPASDD